MVIFRHQEADNAEKKENEIIPNLPPPKVQKVDLAALFTARQLPMTDNECVSTTCSLLDTFPFVQI